MWSVIFKLSLKVGTLVEWFCSAISMMLDERLELFAYRIQKKKIFDQSVIVISSISDITTVIWYVFLKLTLESADSLNKVVPISRDRNIDPIIGLKLLIIQVVGIILSFCCLCQEEEVCKWVNTFVFEYLHSQYALIHYSTVYTTKSKNFTDLESGSRPLIPRNFSNNHRVLHWGIYGQCHDLSGDKWNWVLNWLEIVWTFLRATFSCNLIW